jgi:hypothetical protein
MYAGHLLHHRLSVNLSCEQGEEFASLPVLVIDELVGRTAEVVEGDN